MCIYAVYGDSMIKASTTQKETNKGDKEMTKAQELILRDIRTAPKKWRMPSGSVKVEFLNHFDGRSVKALFSKGLLKQHELGNIKVVEL